MHIEATPADIVAADDPAAPAPPRVDDIPINPAELTANDLIALRCAARPTAADGTMGATWQCTCDPEGLVACMRLPQHRRCGGRDAQGRTLHAGVGEAQPHGAMPWPIHAVACYNPGAPFGDRGLLPHLRLAIPQQMLTDLAGLTEERYRAILALAPDERAAAMELAGGTAQKSFMAWEAWRILSCMEHDISPCLIHDTARFAAQAGQWRANWHCACDLGDALECSGRLCSKGARRLGRVSPPPVVDVGLGEDAES